METGKLKLALSAGALALSMALAGCGGSSSSGGPVDPMGDTEDEDPKYTDADCVRLGGPGRIANTDGDGCIADPNYVSADKAKADAAALYTALTTTGLVRTNNTSSAAAYTAFKAADGEKDNQKIAVQGMPFDKVAMGDGTETSGTGNPEGSYGISNNSSENALDRDEATASAFAPGASVVTHKRPNDGAGVFTTSGEWMGVSGTFYCAGTCTSRNGHPTGDDWRFKPGNVKDRVTGQDAVWGWWISTDASDKITNVDLFYNGGGVAAGDYTDILLQTGSARV